MPLSVITADGETHAIEPRPINLVFHNGTIDVRFPRAVTLDPDVTRHHGERVRVPHASTAALLTIIEGDRPLPRTSAAYHHVVGLLDLTLKLRDAGCQVAWKHPETYLHPWHQANLGDVAISLTKDHQ